MRPHPSRPLKNPHHEAFARSVSWGNRISQAYRDAYRTDNRSAAAKLAKRTEVRARVAELQAERQNRENSAYAALAATPSKDWVLGSLIEIINRALQHVPVMLPNGKAMITETPDGQMAAVYRYDPKSALDGLKLIGQELGMFVDRKAVLNIRRIQDLPDEALQAMLSDLGLSDQPEPAPVPPRKGKDRQPPTLTLIEGSEPAEATQDAAEDAVMGDDVAPDSPDTVPAPDTSEA